jgi:hypothetical protein
MGKLMKRKLALVGTAIILGGATYALAPKIIATPPHSATSQLGGHSKASTSKVEKINGLPVKRLEASISGPTNVEGLIKESELIVIGTIDQSLEESKSVISRDSEGGISNFASVVDFSIKKVLKGDPNLKKQTIKVGQGMIITNNAEGKPYVLAIENIYPFKKKGRYLLFLTPGDPPNYYATTLFYGRHNLDGTDTSEDNIDSPSFKEVRKLVRQQFKDD